MRVTCPACQSVLDYPEELRAKELRCPNCQHAFLAGVTKPLGVEPIDVVAVPEPIDALPATPPATNLPPGVQGRHRETEAEPRPSTRAPTPAAAPSTKPLKALVVAVLLILGGAGAIYFGFLQFRLKSKSADQPQVISCRTLIDRGPGDNVYVVLTDYRLLGDAIVIETGRLKVKQEPWKQAWIPIAPADEKETVEESFAVILETRKVTTRKELDALQSSAQIRGMVINDISSLGRKEEKLLRQSYPEVDFKKCWIIKHEETPEATVFGMVMGWTCGGLLVLVGVLVGLLSVRRLMRPAPPPAAVAAE